MMTLYTPTALARDPVAVLYYSIVLTFITIIVAIVIGVIQLLSLVLNVVEPKGTFWDGVAVAEDYYGVIGGGICASFIAFGGLSILLYKPWRRYVERGRQISDQAQTLRAEEADALLGEQERIVGPEAIESLEEDTGLHRPEVENVWQSGEESMEIS